MVKWVVIFVCVLVSCVSTKKLDTQTVKSFKLKPEGIYLTSRYSFALNGISSAEKIKDSVLYFVGFKFFNNGVFRRVELKENLDTAGVVSYLLQRKKIRTSWGIYEIKGDTISIKTWEPAEGAPVGLWLGRILNDSTINIFDVRYVDCGIFDYRHNPRKVNKNYKYYPINIKTDSISNYINSK